MSDTEGFDGVTFHEPTDTDIPDYRASAPTPEPPPETPKRKRFLPGSQDFATRGERREKVGKTKKPLPPIPPKGFAPGIEKAYKSLSLAVSPFDVRLGEALFAAAPECAEAWDTLARQNEAVRRFIVWATTTTAAGAVLQAHAPIIGLMFARVMGQEKRVTMASMLLGQEAERYANGGEEAA